MCISPCFSSDSGVIAEMKNQPGSHSNSLILGDNPEFKLKTRESVNGEMRFCVSANFSSYME